MQGNPAPGTLWPMRRGSLLTVLILIGLVAGALFGRYVLLGSMEPSAEDHWTRQAGELILVRPLLLLIVPLVFVSVVVAVASIGDPIRLGVVGCSTVLYYLVTMLVAATLGAVLVATFRPGDLPQETLSELRGGAEQDLAAHPDVAGSIERARTEGQDELGGAWLEMLRRIVPANLVAEMTGGRTLGVMLFALLLGLALAAAGEPAQPAVRVFESLLDAMLRVVRWLIWLVPAGVFLLSAWTVGRSGFDDLVGPLAKYVGLVVAGLFIHAAIVLPAVLALATRQNPYRFMWQMRRALLTAFGTASSPASLPVTLESALAEGGCSRRAAGLVLPLGAAVNLNGTALCEAIAVVFLFQLWGIPLNFGELVIVVMTAALAAVGAAGLPGAGAVTTLIVISAVNKALEGHGLPESELLPAAAIGVILGVDRVLEMCRSAANVWGDAVGAKIMTRLAPDPPPH